MAELLVEAFLSVVFEKLFERLASSELVDFIRGKKSIINDEQLKELNLKLKRASRLLNDAEDRQLEEPAVREWLDDLKDVIYRAEALVDEIDYEVLSKKLERDESNKTKSSFRKKMKSKITSGFSKPRKTVQGDEIAEILKDLSSLLENEVGRGLKVEDAHKNSTPTGSSSKIPPAPWREERHVHGRNADKEEIMELLLSNDVWGGKIGVLPIVEGFLQSGQQERQIEEVGEEYFNNLISRSLFQRSASYVETFVVHDLLHDLAMFVSREFCLALDDNKKLELLKSKTRHLSYSSDTKHRQYESMRTILSKAKHLRTFIGLGPSYVEDGQFVAELLSRGRFLRVFSTTHQTTLPSLFSNLKHLRYLNLSATEIQEIPHSVCTMYNLQTLLLSDCWNLTRLPKDMGKLINLRHLETTGTCLVEMPPQMGNLKQLQTLTNFVLSDNDHSSCIKELAELQQLRGKLCISGLQNVNNVEDVLKANLRGKEKLSELELQWEGDTSDRSIEKYEKELEALEPHTNLKKISISGYAGSNFPRWVGDYSKFSNIVSMTLIGNKHCCSLPPLGQLPSLEILIIKSFPEVETIGDEFDGNISSGAVPFPSLEELEIEDMPKWNKWSFNRNQNESGCFPRLKRLRLLENPKVAGSLPNSQKIEDLHICGCDKLMESFPLIHYPSLEMLFLKDCDSINSLPLDCFPMLKALHLDNFQNLESITTPEEIGATLALESLQLSTDYQHESMRTGVHEAKHLRTLIGLGPSYVKEGQFVEELLSRGRFLRVVSTTHQMLPNLSSNLKHLRYLNLSSSKIREIPHSICTMYNLQTLLLSDCKNLTRLPKDMGKLINLRHLETTGTFLVEMPLQMGNLKQLQTLTNFILSDNDHSSCIKELAELQQLRGKLCISGLQNVNNVEDVLKANLRGKEKLSELELQWEGDTSDRGIEKYEKVLDALEPHTNLKKISISGYAGSNFPRWVGDYWKLSNIVSMTLIGNKYCCSLPPLGQLPSLEILIIKSFPEVETIGDEFDGNISSGAVPFPSLEELEIEDMPKWNKWSFNRNQNESGCFPRLKRLRLLENPKVAGSLPNSQKIIELDIAGCDKLMEFFPLIHYPSLEKLSLKDCDSINSLPLDCFPMLKALHLDNFQNLESITTPEEIGATLVLESLRFLTLIDCNNLRSLPQHMHRLLPSLAYLKIDGCPEIESFPQGGLPSKLEVLKIWDCSKLAWAQGF
ncbi:LRR domain containing protein [Parasponia andersonii]|uniref:LRR domain containing protein n=1 Tax=Parasponia andersonii TaxID=3476 RepID=A0A2P5DM82_PARAD|nr:LRR domain containing protein [Parasponia andersonii]